MSSTDEDRIAEIFKDSTIFISGGSGYLGKVLIEKLLRRCNGVKTIYLLIRDKKGKSPQARMNDIFSNMLFDRLKAEFPDAIKKCKPIPGDVTQTNLGISVENRKILQDQVEFIYHSAASTRFDDTVRVATRINTRGTKYMLELAHECKKLKAFVHISTAYAYPHTKILYEKAYAPPANPKEVLNSIDFDKEFDDADEHEHLRLLGNCPNTYTFTKALAEGLVFEEIDKLPVIVVRPSIVCPVWKEPLPGWCNNLQGPMGLFVGAGKGVIRSMYIKGDTYADFIPADVVINGLLTSTWAFLKLDKNQRVYNVTASSDYCYSWEELLNIGKNVVIHDVPFNGILWYPGGSMKKSKLVHNVCFYLFQVVPALFIDALLMVLGYKPILYNIQKRIQKGGEMFEYYTTNKWDFSNEKSMGLTKYMNEKEKEIYKLDGHGMDLRQYLTQCVLGVRRYNLKETDDMLPAAKRTMAIMWCVDLVCKSMLVMAFFYYLFQWVIEPLLKH